MISNRAFAAIALSLGFGVVQMGCMSLTSDDEDVGAIDNVGVTMLNSSGGEGTNGASSVDVADNMEHLLGLGNAPFNQDNENVNKIQLASEGTRNLLSYVVACALPVGSYSINGVDYTGKGLLNSTSSWLTTALSTQAKYDLIACIMAHVNPLQEQVNIRLTGQAVADVMSSSEASAFSTPEALWVVYESPGSGLLVREVWPVPAIAGQCVYTSDDVEFRICGDIDSQLRCGVTVKDTGFWNHCTQSSMGHWSCNGHPAIKTWLTTSGVAEMYPGCAP